MVCVAGKGIEGESVALWEKNVGFSKKGFELVCVTGKWIDRESVV